MWYSFLPRARALLSCHGMDFVSEFKFKPCTTSSVFNTIFRNVESESFLYLDS